MLSLSERIKDVPLSPTRKLSSIEKQVRSEGRVIYNLNIGQPDISTPKEILSAYKNLDLTVIPYTNSAGLESYRNSLVNFYDKLNIKLMTENILVTTGASEALIFTLTTIMDPSDELLIIEPFYTNYKSISAYLNFKIKPIHTSIESNFRLPSISEFEKAITKNTKAILICNPNNPSGYVYSLEELIKLKNLAKKYNLFFISDEVYREFLYDDEEERSILQFTDIDEHAIVIDSVSKRYSACGLRIGAILSKNMQFMSSVLKLAQLRLCPPIVDQMAAEEAIKTPQTYFQHVISEYKERRDTLLRELSKINGAIFSEPKGAFYILVKLPIQDAEIFCKWLLESFDYKNQTVLLTPARNFYMTESSGIDEIRISYTIGSEFIINAIECLRLGLIEYKKNYEDTRLSKKHPH